MTPAFTLSPVTLASSWTVAYQAPLSMGLSWQEYWSVRPCPSSEDLPDPGIKPASPELAGRFFTIPYHSYEKPQSCLHNINNDHHERGQWLYNWYIKSSEYEIYKRKLNVLFYPCSSHKIIDDSLYFSRRTRQPYTKIFRSIKNPVMP